MWVPCFTDAPRAMLRRTLLMLVTPLLVACFFILGPLSDASFANPGVWSDDNLIFDNETYTRAPDEAPDIPNHTAYQWIDTSTEPDRAYLIFFSTEEEVTEQATASRVAYDYSPPDSYTSPSDPEEVDIRNDLLAAEGENSDVGSACDGSIFSGLGWILCPISNWLAEATDNMYGLVQDFLQVPAATTDTSTGLYALWAAIRTIANICFVLVFMAIIYSQITSLGISNYNIKTMLPRLIIGAILVNVSFWLSALAIDISNVLGHSVYAVFDNVRENMTPAVEVDWSGLTALILSGGTIVGSLGFIAAAGGSFTGLGFLMISALASVAFGIFVAFVILAARQALLTVLLLLSPLAFVAFVLPGTQQLFDRWRKSFTTLLMFFPLFALLFGGSAVASLAIMNNANGLIHIVIIGLAVQVVPLLITPFLIQFSTGLLGRIAGMASSKHGLVDRTKNWARENAEHHKDRALGQDRAINPFKIGARALNRRKLDDQNRRAGYQANAKSMARGSYDKDGNWVARRRWEQSDLYRRQAEGKNALSEKIDDNKYLELQAGVNKYRDPRINVRDNVASVVNPITQNRAVQNVTGGAIPEMRSHDQVFQETAVDPATILARDTAIAGLRNTEASREVSQKVNSQILANQELQAAATGIGSRDIMLAGLVSREREDYAKRVNAQDQLMRHFALDSGQYQKIAMGIEDVTEVRNEGKPNETRYTFKFNDEYTREAAIEHQLAAGSVGEKRKIINESGREVVTVQDDGTTTRRPGVNYEFRTTIQDATIKNGVSRAAPYINDKSYNQIIRGEWKGELSEYSNAMREILEARLKAESLASANDGALKVIYELQDLRNGDARQQQQFELYKSDALEIIRNTSSPADYKRYLKDFDTIFDKNYLDIQKEAGKVLDDPELSSRSAGSSREVLERYRAPKTDNS